MEGAEPCVVGPRPPQAVPGPWVHLWDVGGFIRAPSSSLRGPSGGKSHPFPAAPGHCDMMKHSSTLPFGNPRFQQKLISEFMPEDFTAGLTKGLFQRALQNITFIVKPTCNSRSFLSVHLLICTAGREDRHLLIVVFTGGKKGIFFTDFLFTAEQSFKTFSVSTSP